jgi:hypothetical protein
MGEIDFIRNFPHSTKHVNEAPKKMVLNLKLAISCFWHQLFMKHTGNYWLTPVILATHEAEIGRVEVQGLPEQMCKRPHLQNNQHKKGLQAWLKQ